MTCGSMLAATEGWRPSAQLCGWLLCLGLFTLAVVLYVWLSPRVRLLRSWRRTHRRLAAANGLTAAEAGLLWRLARAARLEDPAVAFVRPSLLDGGANVAPELARAVRQKLFGD